MDLSTTYLGLNLKSPLVPSASPLTNSLDTIKRLEDAGAAAIVMHSLFEEQISHEAEQLDHFLSYGTESFAEALGYFPKHDQYKVGPDEYLNNIRKAKETVSVPVIGSLNGISTGGWTKYAKKIEDAGADALELNVYLVPADPSFDANKVEQLYIDILKTVKASVSIPVTMKLSPFFSSLAKTAADLDQAGADGLVLFNRFYQPDIDLEKLEIMPNLAFSSSFEMRLPLRWTAILYGRVKASLAATTGIYTAKDAIKMIMVGADVTMLCSVLLTYGVERLTSIETAMKEWMEEHEYDSIDTMKGSMSQKSCPDPAAFERANYMKTLQSYR